MSIRTQQQQSLSDDFHKLLYLQIEAPNKYHRRQIKIRGRTFLMQVIFREGNLILRC